MSLVTVLPSDEKWNRPKTRNEAVWQIEQTFAFNQWGEGEQVIFLSDITFEPNWKKLPKPELNEMLKKWRSFDNPKLKRILQSFEHYRMILYK